MSFIQRVNSAAPPGYTTPEFPSLYWPLPVGASQSYYLYDPGDIVRFTIYWTLLLVGGIHLIVGLWACIIQWRNWKLIWIAPLIFVVIGGIEALVSGAIVGGLLGGFYQSGYFEMSTWIPFVWAVINTLVLILSSFAIYGGLFTIQTIHNLRPDCHIIITDNDNSTVEAFEHSEELHGDDDGMCEIHCDWNDEHEKVFRALVGVNDIGEPEELDDMEFSFGSRFPVKNLRRINYSGQEWALQQDHSQCVVRPNGVDGYKWEIVMNMKISDRDDSSKNDRKGFLAVFHLAPLLSSTTFGEVLIEGQDREARNQVQKNEEQAAPARKRKREDDDSETSSESSSASNSPMVLSPIAGNSPIASNSPSTNNFAIPSISPIARPSPFASDFPSASNYSEVSNNREVSAHLKAKRQVCDHCKHTGHSQDKCKLIHNPNAPRCTYRFCGKIGHTEAECHARKEKRARKRVKDFERGRPVDTCDYCHHVGHSRDKCKMLNQPDIPRCTYEPCGKLGHTANECRLRVYHSKGGGGEGKVNAVDRKGKGRAYR